MIVLFWTWGLTACIYVLYVADGAGEKTLDPLVWPSIINTSISP
jgi:hypothetical protein